MSYTLGSIQNLFTTGQLSLARTDGVTTLDIITKAFEAEKERLTAKNRMLEQMLDNEREKMAAIQRILNGSPIQTQYSTLLGTNQGGLMGSAYAQMLGDQITAQKCLGLVDRSAKSAEIKKGE